MFMEMRRADRKLPEERARLILAEGEYGVLSTVGENGYPYGVPVNYVFMREKIYFHCANGVGHKLENVRHCPKVSFTVVGKTEIMPARFGTKYESVIAFGSAAEVLEEKRQALEKLIEKYSPDYREAGQRYIDDAIARTAVYSIEVEHITGKACGG